MNSDELLKKLQKICKKYENKHEYVYKSCFDILSGKDYSSRKWLVIMKKLPDTITNETRINVSDRNYAKFRANKLLVIAIINMNKPTLRKKYIVNVYKNKIDDEYFETFYKVGNIVESNRFDDDLNEVCSSGIHYFKTLLPAYYYEKSSIQNGKYMLWRENGELEEECVYKNGKKTGIWTKSIDTMD